MILDEVTARIAAQPRATALDAVLAADAVLRERDETYATPTFDPMPLESVADEMRDDLPFIGDEVVAYPRIIATYVCARLYDIDIPDDLSDEAFDELARSVEARWRGEGKRNYVANVIGAGLYDRSVEMEDQAVRVGDEGVLIVHADAEAVVLVVAAFSLDDAERRVLATFPDGYIDDLSESIDQRPLSVAYTEGRVGPGVRPLLLLDGHIRDYLTREAREIERLTHRMPDDLREEYLRDASPCKALRALDAALDAALRESR